MNSQISSSMIALAADCKRGKLKSVIIDLAAIENHSMLSGSIADMLCFILILSVTFNILTFSWLDA